MPRPQGLTRSFAASPAAPRLYTPAGPYTRRMSPYTSRRLLTRAIGALHAATGCLTLSDDLHFPVLTYFDDAAGLVGLVLLAACPTDVVYCFEDVGGDVTVVLGSRLTTDVRAGADDRFLETVAELTRELLAGDAHSDAAVFGDEVWGEVHGIVEDHRCRLRGQFHHVPCHLRHVAHIPLQTCVAVNEADECLRVVALLNLVNTCHCLRVGGVAADAPDSIGRVENHATSAHHLYCFLNIFFQFHNPYYFIYQS